MRRQGDPCLAPFVIESARDVAAKRAELTSEAARKRFHDRLAAFAQPVSFTDVLSSRPSCICAFAPSGAAAIALALL